MKGMTNAGIGGGTLEALQEQITNLSTLVDDIRHSSKCPIQFYETSTTILDNNSICIIETGKLNAICNKLNSFSDLNTNGIVIMNITRTSDNMLYYIDHADYAVCTPMGDSDYSTFGGNISSPILGLIKGKNNQNEYGSIKNVRVKICPNGSTSISEIVFYISDGLYVSGANGISIDFKMIYGSYVE